MSKFTRSELKKSLLDNITLMQRDAENVWAEFHEVESYLQLGFSIFNEEKKQLFEKMRSPNPKVLRVDRRDFRVPDFIFERPIPKFVLTISAKDLESNMERFKEITDEKSFGEFLYFASLLDKESFSYQLLTRVALQLKEKLPEFTAVYKKAVDLAVHGKAELKSITEARELYRKLINS